MNVQANASLGFGYHSGAQIARVITESWCERELFCAACDSETLKRTQANTPARDFVCGECGDSYQLKSSAKPFSGRIVDGAHSVMLKTLQAPRPPHLLLLQYENGFWVRNLTVVPSFLISLQAIERRNPLSATARRAGWIGCNILLCQLPVNAAVPIVQNGIPQAPSDVRKLFASFQQLQEQPLAQRSWAIELLRVLEKLPQHFTLAQLYEFEQVFREEFPENRHIREKLRQQLQVMRDLGKVIFLGRGRYQNLSAIDNGKI